MRSVAAPYIATAIIMVRTGGCVIIPTANAMAFWSKDRAGREGPNQNTQDKNNSDRDANQNFPNQMLAPFQRIAQ